TSAWTPRAIRAHGPHVPQLSVPAAYDAGRSQFSACARAVAVRRLPTPSGPVKISVDGSDPRETARASSSSNGRWPVTCRNGILRKIYHAVGAPSGRGGGWRIGGAGPIQCV